MPSGRPQVNSGPAYAGAVFQTMREPFLVLDADFRIRLANKSFYQTFHRELGDVRGILIFDLGEGRWNNAQLRGLLEGVSSHQKEILGTGLELDWAGKERKSLLLNLSVFIDEESGEKSILLAIQDMTPLKQAEKECQQFIYRVAHDLRQPVTKVITMSELLMERAGALEEDDRDYLTRMNEVGKNMKLFIDKLTYDTVNRLNASDERPR